MKGPDIPEARKAVRRQVMVGLVLTAGLVLGCGGWAATSELAGAVIANGTLVVDSNSKVIRHPTGGVVSRIAVRNGQVVQEDQVLLQFDATVVTANLAIVMNGINEYQARKGRLEAERDDRDDIVFPAALQARRDDGEVSALMSGEVRLFELRRQSRSGQKSQLRERALQIGQEVEGLTRQAAAKASESELIIEELGGVRKLWETKLIGIQRVMVLERDAVRNAGDRGQMLAQIAQAKGRIGEIELQILQIDQEFRTEVANQLREAQVRLAELQERRVAAEDQLRRIEVRSPRNGIVHQLSVHSHGAVIGPSDTIMTIVPSDDALIVDVRVMPNDIDQIFVGQEARLKFPAFNQKTTPELAGRVKLVSADLSSDPKTGTPYYQVQITLDHSNAKQLVESRFVPGMPVEAYLQTGVRTAMSYLLKPLTDQFSRSFRDR